MEFGILVNNGDTFVIGPFSTEDEAINYRSKLLNGDEEVISVYHPKEAINAFL